MFTRILNLWVWISLTLFASVYWSRLTDSSWVRETLWYYIIFVERFSLVIFFPQKPHRLYIFLFSQYWGNILHVESGKNFLSFHLYTLFPDESRLLLFKSQVLNSCRNYTLRALTFNYNDGFLCWGVRRDFTIFKMVLSSTVGVTVNTFQSRLLFFFPLLSILVFPFYFPFIRHCRVFRLMMSSFFLL